MTNQYASPSADLDQLPSEASDFPYLVAEIDDRVVGYCYASAYRAHRLPGCGRGFNLI